MSENSASPRPTPQPFCSFYERLLPMLHMGLLSEEERSDVEAHLAECAWCQNQLATYDVLDAALRRQFGGETVASPVDAPHTVDAPRTRPTLTLEEIMQVSNQRPPITLPPAPSSEHPPSSRLSTLGTIAAVLVLTVLVASLFAYFGSRGAAPATSPTPTPNPTPSQSFTLPPFALGTRLLATAVLDAAALLIAALLCVALGVFMRFRPRAATAVIGIIRPVFLAVPAYVLGLLLILVFNLQLHLFPVRATNAQIFDPRWLFLPALTLAIGALALTMAQLRSRLFAFARADGSQAASWAVIGLHLLGAILSWTFVVEIIFGWPGLGQGAFMYGIFLYGDPEFDLGTVFRTLWSIILVTSALYLVVALATGAASRVLGRRGAMTGTVTDSEPDAPEPVDAGPGGRSSLPRWATLTLLGIGTALVAAVVLATIFAPLLTHYNPVFIDLNAMNSPPSAAHPLGADDLGRDILSELLYMGRNSLGISALAVVLAAVSGLALAALLRLIPTTRRRLSVVVDGVLTVLIAFPALFLALGLVDLLHPGFTSLVVVFATLQAPTFARLGLTLMRPRGRDSAGRSSVAQRQSALSLIGRLLAQASISMAIVLVEVSALTFFFGPFVTNLLPPPFSGSTGYVPSLFDWGTLIGTYQNIPLASAWYPPSLDAALALGICVLGFTLAGQALRSLLELPAVTSQQRGG